MRDMSRAIRHELTEYGPTLETIPDRELGELTEILGAFFYDLVGEQDRRGGGSPRPAATVAHELKILKGRVVAHHEHLEVNVEECPICAVADAEADKL